MKKFKQFLVEMDLPELPKTINSESFLKQIKLNPEQRLELKKFMIKHIMDNLILEESDPEPIQRGIRFINSYLNENRIIEENPTELAEAIFEVHNINFMSEFESLGWLVRTVNVNNMDRIVDYINIAANWIRLDCMLFFAKHAVNIVANKMTHFPDKHDWKANIIEAIKEQNKTQLSIFLKDYPADKEFTHVIEEFIQFIEKKYNKKLPNWQDINFNKLADLILNNEQDFVNTLNYFI